MLVNHLKLECQTLRTLFFPLNSILFLLWQTAPPSTRLHKPENGTFHAARLICNQALNISRYLSSVATLCLGPSHSDACSLPSLDHLIHVCPPFSLVSTWHNQSRLFPMDLGSGYPPAQDIALRTRTESLETGPRALRGLLPPPS